jgi:hypothetical protein
MAGVVITVSVGGGAASLADDLDAALEEEGWEWVIVRGPHACGPCRANQNPHNIPCAQCTGYTRTGDTDGPDDDADDSFQCQCRVFLRRKHGGDMNDEDLNSLDHL